jgi:hypothetical protein
MLLLKTKGKLNAVAPATGLSTDVSAIVTSEGTSTELETERMPTWAGGL